MTLQLGMTREDREPADVLSAWALKEYERLQQEAPNLGGSSVGIFKSKFSKDKQSFPDVAEDAFVIKIYDPNEVVEVNQVVQTSSTNEIELNLVSSS